MLSEKMVSGFGCQVSDDRSQRTDIRSQMTIVHTLWNRIPYSVRRYLPSILCFLSSGLWHLKPILGPIIIVYRPRSAIRHHCFKARSLKKINLRIGVFEKSIFYFFEFCDNPSSGFFWVSALSFTPPLLKGAIMKTLLLYPSFPDTFWSFRQRLL